MNLYWNLSCILDLYNNLYLFQSEPGKKKKKGLLRRKKTGSKKAKKLNDDDAPLLVVTPVVLEDPRSGDITYINQDGNEVADPRLIKGMTDAMMQTTGPGVDAEIAEQDLDSVTDLERELREEGIMVSLQKSSAAKIKKI